MRPMCSPLVLPYLWQPDPGVRRLVEATGDDLGTATIEEAGGQEGGRVRRLELDRADRPVRGARPGPADRGGGDRGQLARPVVVLARGDQVLRSPGRLPVSGGYPRARVADGCPVHDQVARRGGDRDGGGGARL